MNTISQAQPNNLQQNNPQQSKPQQETRGTSVLENSLIWFGAAVSLAEILTGTYFASLGFWKGLAAIIVGHLIGCTLLFLAGLIGAKTRRSSMETAALSFGQKGAVLFATLNVLQLVGWTGIMIYDGALSANALFTCGAWIWCVIIGVLIAAWVLVGIRNLKKINLVAMIALFALTLVFCVCAFSGAVPLGVEDDGLTFGAAVELAVAMPLSWLPLISDYTRSAAKPVAATAASSIVYGLVSCWMYAIGMSMAIFTGEYDIAQIMLKTGLGVAGLIIIIFSTVTTTFLDANSAGVSFESIVAPFGKQVSSKGVALIVTAAGSIGAIMFPMDNITDFLYLIGSVFAPMIAVIVANYFVLKQVDTAANFNWPNLVIWLGGFFLYRHFIALDTPLGATFPVMVVVFVVTCVVGFVINKIASTRSECSQ